MHYPGTMQDRGLTNRGESINDPRLVLGMLPA